MNLHPLHEKPDAVTVEALADFEAQFRYPLAQADWFSISHGADYTRFYRSIGDPAACFIAEENGQVLGSISLVEQPMQTPTGDRSLLYIGDLKALPGLRRGRTLLQLAKTAMQGRNPASTSAYGVVMGGSKISPDAYTGRFGIPPFRQLAELRILRIEAARFDNITAITPATADLALPTYRALAREKFSSLGGRPVLRSRMEPLWLMAANGSACGRLEDTLNAKHLMTADGGELISMHLACFAWLHPATAAQLLRSSLTETHHRGCPALFVCLTVSDWHELRPLLHDLTLQASTAFIFGHGLPASADWIINSSEI